eukprot:352995-Hanusia_phi.AAC.5
MAGIRSTSSHNAPQVPCGRSSWQEDATERYSASLKPPSVPRTSIIGGDLSWKNVLPVLGSLSLVQLPKSSSGIPVQGLKTTVIALLHSFKPASSSATFCRCNSKNFCSSSPLPLPGSSGSGLQAGGT